MNTNVYTPEHTLQGMALDDFPVYAGGAILLGTQFIGTISDAFIDTEALLPYDEQFVVSGEFPTAGYGTCEPYTHEMGDFGVYKDFYALGDPIFVPPQRWAVTSKTVVDGATAIGLFVNEDCRNNFLKYTCGGLIMPCVEHVRDGKTYAFPQSICRGQCEEFVDSCYDALVENTFVIHSIPAMRMYGPELYDTWCDLQVDFSCNPGDDAPYCFEQFRLNSPAAYVDVLQSQVYAVCIFV
jgi:hypothetical protein